MATARVSEERVSRERVSREAVLAAVRRTCAEAVSPTMDELAEAAGMSRAAFYRVVGSRRALFDALGVDPPGGPDRILAAAAELLVRDGLAHLVMDEVAERAGVCRATLYRRFPGRSALFAEVVRTYSPRAAITALLAEMGEAPPEVVMPALAHLLASSGSTHLGLFRRLFFEVTGSADDAGPAVADCRAEVVRPMVAYLEEQMSAGRLRRRNPLLALQAFCAPIIFHLLNRSVLVDHLGFDRTLDESIDELTSIWLAAMAVC